MSVKVYKDQAKTTPIRVILGQLEGNGTATSFTVNENPAEVRKYSTSAPYGELLVSGTDYNVTDNGDGTYTITLTSAPASGETVVAFDAGEPIFADSYAIGNSSVEADRTMEQVLWIAAEGVNAQNVTVKISDLVSGAGADPNWHYLAPDSDGTGSTPGAYGDAGAALNLGDINDGDVVPFWIKVIVPENTPMENYRDVYLEVQSLQFSTH